MATNISNLTFFGEQSTRRIRYESEKFDQINNIVFLEKNEALSENTTAKIPRNRAVREAELSSPTVIKIPKKKLNLIDFKNYFTQSQNWLCSVVSIHANSFVAKLQDINRPGGTYEEAEFDLDDIEEEDMPLLQIGSIFYWSVGIELRNGSRSRVSIIRFKRLPALSVKQIDNAADLASELFDNLNWE